MPEQLNRIELKLAELQGKIDATYTSSEKMRKYFLWTMYITIGALVIPLFIMPFVLPSFFAAEGVGAGTSSVDTQQLQGLLKTLGTGQ